MDTTTASRPPAAPATGGPPTGSGLARWCIRYRWLVLAASVVFLAAGVGLMGRFGITIASSESELVGDSAAAQRAIDSGTWDDPESELVVVTLREGSLSEQQAAALGAELEAAFTGTAGTEQVGPVVPGVDGRSLVLPVALVAPEPTDVDIAPLLDRTAEFAQAHPQLQVGQYGAASANREVAQMLSEDFVTAEYSAIPLTLIILLIAFGSVVAAGVPLLLGVGAVGVALGLTAVWSHEVFAVTQTAQSMLLLIGLAVGVDYALFVTRRAREERSRGLNVADSIAVAAGSAGRAVVVSGITVVVALGGLLVAGGLFRSLAIGAIFVVGVAVVAAATTLPALLAILGDKVDALRMPWRRRTRTRSPESGFWGRLAGVVTAAPLAWAAGTAALLLALSVPAFGMKTALGGAEALPQDLAFVQAYHQVESAMPTEGTHLTLVVASTAENADRVTEVLSAAGPALLNVSHVTEVAATTVMSTDRTAQYLPVGVGLTVSDERLSEVVQDVRTEVVPDLQAQLEAAGVPDAQVHVGGDAGVTDLDHWMDERLPWVVAFVLVLTFAVMLVSFGSPWLALTTIGLNALSVGAAYGVTALVFGGTWAQDLLDFTSTGAIASWLPTVMFVILFGLSMDYHVFVVSRVRESYAAGQDIRTAIRTGVARSAGVVTAAAAVMIGVFSIFGTLSLLEFKQLGVGLAVAVLLDATLVRGVLLPATLALLGRRAHTGPRWLPTIRH